MKNEEMRDASRATYYTYAIKPALTIIGFLITGTIIDVVLEQVGFGGTLLGIENPFTTLFVLLGIIIALLELFQGAAQIIKGLIPRTPEQKFMETLENSASVRKNRDPDSYLYLNREELKRYYAYYVGSCGVLDTVGQENTRSGRVGVNSGITASAEEGWGDSKHYKVLPETLFETVEDRLRNDFIKLNDLNELNTNSYVWVDCNLDSIVAGFSNKTRALTENVTVDLFGFKTGLFFEKKYFSPALQSYFQSGIVLNYPVEMLCKIVKQGDRPFVTPMVIKRR